MTGNIFTLANMHVYVYIGIHIHKYIYQLAVSRVYVEKTHTERQKDIGLSSQKSPVTIGSFAKRDLQVTASYTSLPPCG